MNIVIKNNKNSNKMLKYFKVLITRLLLGIILVLIVLIYTKGNDEHKTIVKKYILEDSLKFTKINNWYKEKLGSIVPTINNNDLAVFNNDITTKKYESYLDGVKIEYKKGEAVTSLNGGIVIFIGDKEGYGKTLIVQGNDGIDYWYANIDNINPKIYDYIEKDSIIGESINDYIYLVLEKDGKFIKYEENIIKN